MSTGRDVFFTTLASLSAASFAAIPVLLHPCSQTSNARPEKHRVQPSFSSIAHFIEM